MLSLTSIAVRWLLPQPSGVGVITGDGGSAQLSWGRPVAGFQRTLLATAHSAEDVAVGTAFGACTLELSNDLVVGTQLTSATLELTLNLADGTSPKFRLPVTITTDATTEQVTITVDTESDLTSGAFRIGIQGFQQEDETYRSSWRASAETVVSYAMWITVLESDLEGENCAAGGFTPAFDISHCDLPAVCPLDDSPILEDCGIPEAPLPLIDCPAIDIPTIVGLALPPGEGTPGPPGPPGPPGESGCVPQITTSYETKYVKNCDDQRVVILPILLPPCSYHLHIVAYLCKPYQERLGCCTYACCNGEWILIEGHEWCQEGPSETPTTPYPDYDGPPIVLPPQSLCEEDGITVVKCPCDTTTTTPEPYCVEPKCGYSECGLMESVMSVVFAGGDCVCEFEATATYEDGRWTTHSTNCDGDSISLSCFSQGSGDWQMVVNCNGDSRTAAVVVQDNGDGTCSFVGRFRPEEPDNSIPNCCGAGSNTITFIGTKCAGNTSTTQEPPECAELPCMPGKCAGAPGVADLVVDGSVCLWPTTIAYKNGCWVAESIDCTGSTVSICCAGGQVTITITEDGVTDTVTAEVTTDGSCLITGKFESPPFPSPITVIMRYDSCETGGTTPAPEDCIDTAAAAGGSTQFGATAEISVTGGDCCSFSDKAVFDADSGCWEFRQLNCSDVTGKITLCPGSGGWTITISCGNGTVAVPATVTDNGNTVTIHAVFDSNDFTDCCAGHAAGDITVSATLSKCCTDDRKKCHWIWVWTIPPTPGNPGVGQWVLDASNTNLCPDCSCEEPPIPANPVAGQTAETDGAC